MRAMAFFNKEWVYYTGHYAGKTCFSPLKLHPSAQVLRRIIEQYLIDSKAR
jgi:hypothetical protein